MKPLCLLVTFLIITQAADHVRAAEPASDPLSPWKSNVTIKPLDEQPTRHSIHSYYVTNPESPDGRWVLFFTSTTPQAHDGDVRIRERSTQREVVLAKGVSTEDAHRAACQQWSCGGRQVVFHDVRDGQWLVAAVDVATQQERVLIRDRQAGFGDPLDTRVPVYGCHWAPANRDLQMIDVMSGQVETAVTAQSVMELPASAPWIKDVFKGEPISLFLQVVSPDHQRVFFKLALPLGGDYRSKGASTRQGLIVFDFVEKQFQMTRGKWGHPAWHGDSRQIIEMGNLVFDSRNGSYRRMPGLPNFRGCHPSFSPDGTLFVCDAVLDDTQTDTPGEWGIVVGDVRGTNFTIIHKFDNNRGARSWRGSHPHPIFSRDGKRIYYNVNRGPWTQLHVAERS